MAVKCTETPVAFVGIGFCMYRYSIHGLMLSSDMAGVPAAGMPRQVWPGDWSVTVPCISTLVPWGTATFGAVTVVAV